MAYDLDHNPNTQLAPYRDFEDRIFDLSKKCYSSTTNFVPFEMEKYTSGELFLGGQCMRCIMQWFCSGCMSRHGKNGIMNCKH